MSVFHTVACQLKVQHEVSVLTALEKVGYKYSLHNEAVGLNGAERREAKANIVIQRNMTMKVNSEIGLSREEDGTYKIHVAGNDKYHWDQNFPKLVMHYAQDVVMKMVQNGPYQWDSQNTDNSGVTTIKLRVHA
jgi:hypothetical protein